MKFLLILLGFIGVLSYEQTSTYVPEQSKTVTKSKTPSQSIDTFNDIDINLRDIVIDNDIEYLQSLSNSFLEYDAKKSLCIISYNNNSQ